jgi:pimeloyl-ACP methyl ester carboxylesterase
MLAARHPEAVGRAMVVDMLPFMGVLFGPPGATPESVRETADKLRDQIQGANGVAWALATQQNMGSMVKTEAMRSLAGRRRPPQRPRHGRARPARADHHRLRPELGHITAPVTVLYVRRRPPR